MEKSVSFFIARSLPLGGLGADLGLHPFSSRSLQRQISIRNTEITFSIWDLGGQREFVNMLPLVCNDAVAILFMFDLSRKSTLNSIKEWYRQARGFNKVCRGSSAHSEVKLTPARRRQRFHSSSVPNTTTSTRSRKTSRRRSRGR